jgi:hypothetical protein
MSRRTPDFLALACSLLLLPALAAAQAVVNSNLHDGIEVGVDLPMSQHVRNFGAPADKKGLCVFATLDMAARWQNVRPLIGIIHKLQQGGGWPEKVEQVVRRYGEGTEIVQYQGTDPAFLELALRTGRPCGVTYGYSERYNMETIYHMVLLVHFDATWACIIDNNFPGTFEWMPRGEFLKRWKHPSGQGWAYMLVAPPPPPVPCN